MATRFELILPGADPAALRAAGEEALDEIERCEERLSLYRPTSEIAHANARAAFEPVRLSRPVFQLLQQAQRLNVETGGLFDITIGPLMQCWGLMNNQGRVSTQEEIAAARERTGPDLVELCEQDLTVRFRKAGVMLDLGAIGKGYAIDRAVDCLRALGIANALIHGGTSSIYGLGNPPDAESWKILIEAPASAPSDSSVPFETVGLNDMSLSVSARWGRQFQHEGKTYGHVIDPRTGRPAEAALLAAVMLPSATEADALSTALLVGGPGSVPAIDKWQGVFHRIRTS